MNAIVFTPIYQERVWGGRNLERTLNRKLPDGKTIGESWEIVDRPEACSRTAEGTSLRELIAANPEGIMGSGWDADRPFPILVKWLDCHEKLSLQVHPPEAVAEKLGGEPKTECWYIAHAEPHATLIAGLKKAVRKEDFEEALKANALEPLVHTFPVKSGESVFIPSGRLHAIGGGNLILEIQQNSDTTYRVYDWGRVGLNGRPRELHVEASLESINFDDFEPAPIPSGEGSTVLVECEAFTLRKEVLAQGESLSFPSGVPAILSILAGDLRGDDDTRLQRSQNALLPAAGPHRFTATEDSELLVTTDFV